MNKIFDLSDKTILITGAGGILGTFFSMGLAKLGANVGLVDLVCTKDLAENIQKKCGVNAQSYRKDITDPDQVNEVVTNVERDLGPIDVLHNNAATKGKDLSRFFDSLESYDYAVWKEIMAVNLDAMFLMAQAVGSQMAKREKGCIIQTSSIYGIVAPDQRIYEGSSYLEKEINTPAVYSASKAGVIGLTKYLASYWGHRSIRVNTLVLGGVESGQNDHFQKQYSKRVPLGRMATKDDLIGPLAFLASDASRYITGQSLVVDGGFSIW